MISHSAEYSLRAVACLADHAGHSLTIRQVAHLTRVPAGYLAKILAVLSRAGLVAAQRGLNGGYSLVGDPQRLTLLDIIKIVDPSHRIATCPLGIDSHCGGNLCSLHRRIDDAAAAAERVLARSTIADVLADTTAGRPVWEKASEIVPLKINDKR